MVPRLRSGRLRAHGSAGVLGEYDGNNNLLRKYTYGPGIDQPVSMTEVGDSSSPYYYHYDALGSVVALSDSTGDTVQTYEYSVYGQVAVEDANHPNPYMFAGRRFDMEIGLYYNRARYYNPYTGRFLQVDPIGYQAGMNLYAYCGNGPIGRTDPSGLEWVGDMFHVKIAFYDGGDDSGFWELDGDDWRECADDDYFDVAINLRTGEDWGYGNRTDDFGDLTDFVIRQLGHPEDWAGGTDYLEYLLENPGDYSKIKITDVYFFDHGTQDTLDIGDRTLANDELNTFLSGVGTALDGTGADATLHFRGCQIGNTDSFLQNLAAWSGHTVTGVWGDITMRWIFGEFPAGPDYDFQYGLWQATSSGEVTTLYRNRHVYMLPAGATGTTPIPYS